MKTFYLLFILIPGFVFGQQDTLSTRQIERSIDGRVYVCDTVSGWVYNKSNTSFKGVNFITGSDYKFEETTPLIDLYRKVFSKEKVEALNKVRNKNLIIFRVHCNQDGKILDVIFNLKSKENYKLITLQEIKALEDYLKNYQFKFYPLMSERKLEDGIASITFPIHFRRLYPEE